MELWQANSPDHPTSAQQDHAGALIALVGQHSDGRVATCVFQVYVEFAV